MSSSNFPKGLHQCAPLPTAVPFVPTLVTTSPFHLSHSGRAGQHFIFISIPIVGKFVGCDWCLNFLSFLLVAEILLFQFFLKVILPTGNLLSSFLSLPYLFIVISPWGLLSVTFAHTSQSSLWATPAGAAVTFVGVLCGSCGSPPPVDSRGPWFEFSALPHPYPPWD